MSAPKFTRPLRARGRHVVDARDTAVAEVFQTPSHPNADEACANANLFAEAPELYAALEAIVKHIEGCVDVEDGSYESGPRPNWAMTLNMEYGRRARIALKKARGES